MNMLEMRELRKLDLHKKKSITAKHKPNVSEMSELEKFDQCKKKSITVES